MTNSLILLSILAAKIEKSAIDSLYRDMNRYRQSAGAAALTPDTKMEEIMGRTGCSITRGHGHNTYSVNLSSIFLH